MRKATGIKLHEIKNDKGKIITYSVMCTIEDDSFSNGKRNIHFTLDENFVGKLSKKSASSKKSAISSEIKKAIKAHHKKWVDQETKEKTQKKHIEGDELKTKIGFSEMIEDDFL